ncbi:hypothetical protein BCR36DRAFT_353969 [Piromyces finnis]|uniref:Transglutaminase-like domain-containing protein n=1 Tax=Piromyces finnis TaxID=1754191 RepID=A0A1Y1V726_9FUNG|nr:hypothetical protein BCR36DRAFT_353969 [Piromyces finnis]|eukprot:ORX48907.1 hypothetical protein BCR36DRAFT_353969 [Piromyces finnis]
MKIKNIAILPIIITQISNAFGYHSYKKVSENQNKIILNQRNVHQTENNKMDEKSNMIYHHSHHPSFNLKPANNPINLTNINNNRGDDIDNLEYLESLNKTELYEIKNIYNNTYKNPIYYLNQVNKFVKKNKLAKRSLTTEFDEVDDDSISSSNNDEDNFFEFGKQLDGFSLFVYETLIDIAFSATRGVKLSTFYYYGVNFFEVVKDTQINALISTGYSAFTYDYPDVWWHKKIGFSVCKNTNDQITKIAFQIVSDLSASEINRMTSEIDIVTDKIIAGAPRTTEFEDFKYFHDTLVTLIEYNITAPHRFSIYGALVDHRAVCEGYGESFKLLARKVGLDVICVPSKEHLWNYARIDKHWYLVDITFDDPGTTNSSGELVYSTGNGSNVIYTYFMVGEDFFEKHAYSIKSHTINKSLTYVNGTKEFVFPELSQLSYTKQFRNQISSNLMNSMTDGSLSSFTFNPIRSLILSILLGFILIYYI